MRSRRLIGFVIALLVTSAGLGAAAPQRPAGPQPIFAAFSLTKHGKLRQRRCGTYRIVSGTYTGQSATSDVRLAGAVTYTGWIALSSGSTTGVARGTLVVRDSQKRVRMRSTFAGVVTNSSTVNGTAFGRLVGPSELLLANVTMVFDEALRFAAVRFGLESGQNSAVAYPAVPKC